MMTNMRHPVKSRGIGAKVDVSIHNRFDFEFRHAITGEIREEYRGAYAENIVLNNMYTRLCARSTYFNYIFFGTGTGTLSPSRTGLFTPLGYKAVVNDTQSKALPTSWWRQKIVLNPEEYVGAALSEVGIGFGTTQTTDAITHALIKDAEGNPITLTKTALDIVTIYATIYATFSTARASIAMADPNANPLVSYLIGGTTWPSLYFRTGKANLAHVSPQKVLRASDPLGLSSTINWVSDVTNKKIYGTLTGQVVAEAVGTGNGSNQVFELDNYPVPGTLVMKLAGTPTTAYTLDGLTVTFTSPPGNGVAVTADYYRPYRFGTDYSNGHVREVGICETITNVILRGITRLLLPDAGGYIGMPVVGASVGTGNASRTIWDLASKWIDPASLKIYVDTVEQTTGITKTTVARPDFFTSLAVGEVQVSGETYFTTACFNGDLFAGGGFGSTNCYVWLYRWINNQFEFVEKISVGYQYLSYCYVNAAGDKILAQCSGGYVYSHKTAGVWTHNKITCGIVSSCYAMSKDGVALSMCAVNSSYKQMWRWNGASYDAVTSPEWSTEQVFSADGSVWLMGYNSDLKRYSWNGSAYIHVATKALGQIPSKIVMNEDASRIMVGFASGQAFRIYDWNGSTYIEYTDVPAITSTQTVWALWFNSDLSMFVLGSSDASNYRKIYYKNELGVWVSESPTDTEMIYSCDNYQYAGQDSFVTCRDSSLSPTRLMINESVSRVTFDTPPANGAVITADYTVNGIHKTAQRVIDLYAEITFGEVT